MYNKEKIYEIAKGYSETKQKPYVTILQPRRNMEETPAQQLSDWKNRHIDATSMAVSYHAIGGYPVDLARNTLIDEAIKDDAEYVLFVDEDTVLPFNGLNQLLKTAKEYPDTIVNGIYYVKFGSPMLSVKDEQQHVIIPDVTPNQIIRNVFSIGLGCTLIPMKIIKKLQAEYPELPLFCIVPEGCFDDENIKMMGEDTWFYQLCKNLNVEVIADTNVQCLHMELKTGKYEAYHDINLEDYVTNIPITERLTMADRARVSKDYFDRINTVEDKPC
jgi:hypothetical protein